MVKDVGDIIKVSSSASAIICHGNSTQQKSEWSVTLSTLIDLFVLVPAKTSERYDHKKLYTQPAADQETA